MPVLVDPYRFAAAGGGGAWTPADLATLGSWYDPSDTANRTIVSLLFTALANKEGTTSRNVAQATTTNCPALDTTIAGRDCMTFDGVDNWMGHSAPNLFAAGECTVAYVIQAAVQSDKYCVSEADTGATNIYAPANTYFSGSNGTPTGYIQVHGGSVQFPGYNDGTVVAYESGNPHLVVVTDTGSSMAHYVDGFTSSTKTYTRAALAGLNNFTIGCLRFSNNTYNFYNGRMGEIVCCTSALNTSDRQKLEGYLAHRWGTSDELDAGHPYKSGAP